MFNITSLIPTLTIFYHLQVSNFSFHNSHIHFKDHDIETVVMNILTIISN